MADHSPLSANERLRRMYHYQELLSAISHVDDDSGAIRPMYYITWYDLATVANIMVCLDAADQVSNGSLSASKKELLTVKDQGLAILEDAWNNLHDCIDRLARGEDVVATNNLGGLLAWGQRDEVRSRLAAYDHSRTVFAPEERLEIFNILHNPPISSQEGLADAMRKIVELECVKALHPPLSIEPNPDLAGRTGTHSYIYDEEEFRMEMDGYILLGDIYTLRRLAEKTSLWLALQEFAKANSVPTAEGLEL